jgi:phosphoserine phosphatase RsbU/P
VWGERRRTRATPHGEEPAGRAHLPRRSPDRARRRAEKALRALREELQLAREVQRRLFPAAPGLPGLDVAGASYPAEATGGDYYDFFPLADGRLALAIGDVSGHGLGPALLMASARASLRALARSSAEPGEILARANDALAEDTGGERFVTLLLAALDPATGSLSYASAGHSGCYQLDASGEVKARLASTGPPLGVIPGAEFRAGPALELAAGDALLLLTDGVAEACAPDGCPFGLARALAVVRAYRADPARRVIDNLYHAVRAFAHNRPQVDDITAVVAKVVR